MRAILRGTNGDVMAVTHDIPTRPTMIEWYGRNFVIEVDSGYRFDTTPMYQCYRLIKPITTRTITDNDIDPVG